MKNLKVEALIIFEDKLEKIKRNVGDTFEVTKERYEFLASKNAVKLVEEIVEDVVTEEEVVDEIVEEKPKKKARRK